ncbi:MAG: hypothetical protein WC009_06810 [Methylotenera sp.]
MAEKGLSDARKWFYNSLRQVWQGRIRLSMAHSNPDDISIFPDYELVHLSQKRSLVLKSSTVETREIDDPLPMLTMWRIKMQTKIYK